MPQVIDKGELIVILSAKEVREAVEHAAWCAAVNNDTSIAVQGDPRVVPYGDGYRVTSTRKE